jgi:hypothetical protein
MKTDPNAPAFARATDNPNLIGLTKREYFVAAALQGLLATHEDETLCVKRAIHVADQLVAELGTTRAKTNALAGLDVYSQPTVISVEQKK